MFSRIRYSIGFLICSFSLIASDIQFHGYGELHYNAPESGTKKLDLHRFVLGMHYDFKNHWTFDMELDFEHAFDEPEFEFMHLDRKYNNRLNFRTGLILMPMGGLNQTHEPPLFLSVERPYTQKNIIPTTWQAPGFGVFGQINDSFSYQAYLITGMEAQGSDGSKGIRGWRSKGINSKANDLAAIGRIVWESLGKEIGMSLYRGGVDQLEEGPSSDLTFYDIDFRYQIKGFQITGMYAVSSITGVEDLNSLLNLEGSKSVGTDQWGTYLTVGYDVLNGRSERRLVPFIQIEKYDTQDGVPQGWTSADTEKQVTTFGCTYFPFDDLAIKIDYEDWEDSDGVLNLGIGFRY